MRNATTLPREGWEALFRLIASEWTLFTRRLSANRGARRVNQVGNPRGKPA